MRNVGVKIMLRGGHAVQVERTEAAAKELIASWERFMEGKEAAPLMRGAEAIQGRPWWWSINLKEVVGVHTFIVEGDPAGGKLDVPPWRSSGA